VSDRTRHLKSPAPQRRVTARGTTPRPTDTEIAKVLVDLDEENKTLRRSVAKVSRILGRLQERGLIETRGPPLVAPWLVPSLERDGVRKVLIDAADEDREPSETHETLVTRCLTAPPDSAADLLGPSPSGNLKRAYADLVTWGVIVPPARRWPTEAGLRLLEQT